MKNFPLPFQEIAKTLLSYGAPVNAKTSVSALQTTALMTAAASGNLEMVKLLVENGAVVEQQGQSTTTVDVLVGGIREVL